MKDSNHLNGPYPRVNIKLRSIFLECVELHYVKMQEIKQEKKKFALKNISLKDACNCFLLSWAFKG